MKYERSIVPPSLEKYIGSHLYYVWSDPDFQEDLDYMNELHRVRGEENPSPSETERLKLASLANNEYDALASKYCISRGDIDMVFSGFMFQDDADEPYVGYVRKEDDTERIIVSLSNDITYRDYVNLWLQVKPLLQRPTGVRKRLSENSSLVYAIFKAKEIKRLTYKEIYELYSRGRLPGYDGSTKQFGDSLALSEYYRRYRPTPD